MINKEITRPRSIQDVRFIIELARYVATQPGTFYAQMPVMGGYAAPLWFVAVMAILSTVITLFFELVGLWGVEAKLIPMWVKLLLPVWIVIGSFLLAGLMRAIWHLMGSDQDYETAYRCVAYSAALLPVFAVIRFIPYVGVLLVHCWWLWLMIVASHAIHQISKPKATIVLGLISLVILSLNLKEEQVERKSTERLEQFNEQMQELQEMSKDLE